MIGSFCFGRSIVFFRLIAVSDQIRCKRIEFSLAVSKFFIYIAVVKPAIARGNRGGASTIYAMWMPWVPQPEKTLRLPEVVGDQRQRRWGPTICLWVSWVPSRKNPSLHLKWRQRRWGITNMLGGCPGLYIFGNQARKNYCSAQAPKGFSDFAGGALYPYMYKRAV